MWEMTHFVKWVVDMFVGFCLNVYYSVVLDKIRFGGTMVFWCDLFWVIASYCNNFNEYLFMIDGRNLFVRKHWFIVFIWNMNIR